MNLSHPFSRRVMMLLLAATALTGLLAPAHGTKTTPKPRAEVTALWLINLTRFVDWPASQNDDLVIAVLQDEPVFKTLKNYEHKRVKGRTIQIRHFNSFAHQKELRNASILFISHSLNDQKKEILAFTKRCGVFTVGETKDFIDQGGVMALRLTDRKSSYEINRSAAALEKITISSDLLGRASRILGQESAP